MMAMIDMLSLYLMAQFFLGRHTLQALHCNTGNVFFGCIC